MTPRSAITTCFFINGALFASWVSRIPAISHQVGATPGTLGLALLAPALAAAATIPLLGRLLAGRSSRTFCRLGIAVLTLAVVLPALARSVPELAAMLLLVGIGNSLLELSMNAQGITIERHSLREILGSLHGAFSFGGFAGAALGSLAAALHIAPLPHLLTAAVLFGGGGLYATTALLPSSQDATDEHQARPLTWRRLPRRLTLLGAAALFALMAEGGAADWSAKLVHENLKGTAAAGALAYALFSLAMAGGRLLADPLWSRWGATQLLRRSGTLAAAGIAVGLSIGTPTSTIIGFGVLGLGLSGVIPTLFRASAEQTGLPASSSLAAVAYFGYLGFLAGPPIIGGIAQITTLRGACTVLVLATLMVAILAPNARRPATRPRLEAHPNPAAG